MKRLTAVTLLFAVGVMFGTSPALAHQCPMMKKQSKDTEQSKAMKKGMKCKMMKKHLKNKHGKDMKEGMHGKMMKKHMSAMSDKKVTPTEDGGVLVQIGRKLIKYDEKMNKVGDATVQLSGEDMRGHMEHMQKMREICHKKMKENGGEKEDAAEETEMADEAASELSDEEMRELINRMEGMLEEKSEQE